MIFTSSADAASTKDVQTASKHVNSKTQKDIHDNIPEVIQQLRKLCKETESGWSSRVLKLSATFFRDTQQAHKDDTHPLKSKNIFSAVAWRCRGHAMLAAGHARQAQKCAEQGLKVLATLPSDMSSAHRRISRNCSKLLSALATSARMQWYSCPLASHGHPLGVSALYAVRFTLQHIHHLGPHACKKSFNETTGQICANGITIETFPLGLSLIDSFAREGVGPASVFVSHSWSCPWLTVVQAMVVREMMVVSTHTATSVSRPVWMELYNRAATLPPVQQLTVFEDALKTRKPRLFFWVDIFCKNQHVVESEATAKELSNCVRGAGRMLLVLHPLTKPVALSRVWCLFEILTCLQCGVELRVGFSFDSLREMDDAIMHNRHSMQTHKGDRKSKVGSGSSPIHSAVLALDHQRRALVADIDITRAQATVAADREAILQQIRSTLGVTKMNETVKAAVSTAVHRGQVSIMQDWSATKSSRRWTRAAQDFAEST